MGDSGLTSNKKTSSLTEVFEKECPYFMAIGMSYNEFWYDDCWLAQYYLKAHKIKKEQENEKLWLQGVYIYEALCCVAPVLHAFSKKGTKPLNYSRKPYPLYEQTEEEKEQEAQKDREKAKQFFENWVKQTRKKFKANKNEK